jgi:tetratricopeptide (TPR) repeat protein
MRRTLPTLLLLTATAAPAAADTVHLRDGRTLVGHIKRADNVGWIVTADDGRPTYVAGRDVRSMELTARPPNDPVAAGRRLDALRRSVAHADDPAKVVDQYRRFIDAGADPATLAATLGDLAVWQDRVDHHLVRLGERWLAPAAREQGLADAQAFAGAARQLLRQGRFAEADPVLSAALSIDPQNVSALYLQGLVRLQQNQLPEARTAFEAVAAALPDHGPTRVNLAFVAWQQGRYADALARYDEAMIRSPANPAVLANVAAALAAPLPPAVARNDVVDRVTQRYQTQQKRLVDRMTKLGRHPFGNAWLTDAQWADVRRGQQQDRVTLAALATDVEKWQDKVRQTDLALAGVQEQIQRSALGSPGPWLASYDGDGPGLSAVYADLRDDAAQLRQRRVQQVQQLKAVQDQATAVRRRMAGEQASVQQPVGPEGTPARIPFSDGPAGRAADAD